MSGHSKWHNIQKTKGAQDAKRAQAFTKIAREMIVAVKEGGSGDPANNSRLAAVIARHMALLRRYAAPDHPDAAVWKMRSVVPRYVKHLPGAKTLRLALCHCHSWDDVTAALTQTLGPLPAVEEEGEA